jgi:hypothetical protein
MTEKLYPHTRYKWHLFVVRLVILGPVSITKFVAECIESAVNGVYDVLQEILPVPYVQTRVGWDKLTPREQKSIEHHALMRDTTKERITFQTQKQK